MDLFFPIAGVSAKLLYIVGLGGVIGMLSGLFGVGGGFLMTPLLIMMGIPPTVAAASDANQIVGASTSGSLVHYRQGNIDIKMGIILLLGGATGGVLGTFIIKYLREMGNADFVISISYVVLLSVIGVFMFYESLKRLKDKSNKVPRQLKDNRFLKSLPLQTEFPSSGIRVSLLFPISLGFFVGIMAAIMGVGGGFLMIPAMTYGLRMPMKMVVGTSLFQILFTSIIITVMQASVNHTVDVFLAIAILIGSTIGVQVGARLGQHLSGQQLKIILAIIVLLVAVKMIVDLVTAPEFLLAPMGGH